ncbi:MAG: amidohydrolase [bacterium]|nr:amidohydrolase [bacterium]
MIDALPDRLLLDSLATLRRTLHDVPEPAGHEALTAQIIANFLSVYAPDELLLGLGGHGVAAVFESGEEGPTLVVRCELDALAVEPDGSAEPLAKRSAAHRCGHDGHMSIVAGLAPILRYSPPAKGRVVLLFQPAEETGEGALRIVDDARFETLRPDAVLGFHNLPGHPLGSVVVREGLFTRASTGVRVRLDGIPGHAAQPELARPPTLAVADLLLGLSQVAASLDGGRIVTVTHASLGRPSFGLSPGHAEVLATLRAEDDASLRPLKRTVEELVVSVASEHELSHALSWHESFPACRNDPGLTRVLADCARARGVDVRTADAPFAWSEDFGVYSLRWPSVYFGLGAGMEAAALHHDDYRFPDECLSIGLGLLTRTIARLSSETRFADAMPPVTSPSRPAALRTGGS